LCFQSAHGWVRTQSNVGASIHAGIEIVADHSGRMNGLFADRPHRNDPSRPNSLIQHTKTPTPSPTQPYPNLSGIDHALIHFPARSRASFTRDAPAAAVAARRRHQAPPLDARSGRTWPLNADDGHGEDGGRPCQARPWRILTSSSAAPRLRLSEMEDLLHGVRVDLAHRPSGERSSPLLVPRVGFAKISPVRVSS
jgi:prepilin-type processing-associated H-X9-DG protein